MAQIAVVTGASAGLGTEFAKLFAADRHDVVLVARRKERLEKLAAELEAEHGITAAVVAADLAEPGAGASIEEACETLSGHVTFLVNNAGFGSNGAFQDQELERELAMIQVNVSALVELTGRFLPGMLERGSGRILNIGSTAGFQPGPGMATYYATKAFVNHWSEALAHELKGTGVSVTVSCPGATATEFGSVAGNDTSVLFKTGVATAADVAAEAYHAMHKGKPMIVHGLKNKLGVQALRVSPRAVVKSMAAKLNKT